MGAKQSKRSVDISGKEAEGGGEVAAAGAGGEGRVEQLADADALKPHLNGDAHIQQEQNDKEKELDSGTPENEKDATTEKEGKEEDDKEKEQAPITNGDSEPKVENGESTPNPEEGKKPKKEKVKKKWSLRSISFSRKDKPKQEKKHKEEEPKTNGEPEKVPEETAEAVPEAGVNEVAEEAKVPTEEKDEKTPETPVTEPLTNGTSTGESSKAETPASEAGAPSPVASEAAPSPPAAAEPLPEPEQLPVNGLSLEEPKTDAPELDKPEETIPEPPAAETAEIVPAPEIPKEVCVEQMPLLEPTTPPPLPANPPPSSVASFAATTMAPELTDASLANTADAAIAPLTALSETKELLQSDPVAPPVVTELPQTETTSVSKETDQIAPEVTACESAVNISTPEETITTELNGLKLDNESPTKPEVDVGVKMMSEIPELTKTPETVVVAAVTESSETVNEAVVKESDIIADTDVVQTVTKTAVVEIPKDMPVLSHVSETVKSEPTNTENTEKCDTIETEDTKEKLPDPDVGTTESEIAPKVGEIINVETETVHTEESEVKDDTPTHTFAESIVSETLPEPENIPESEVEISEADDSSLPPPPIQDEDDSVAILEDADDKVAESLKQIPEPIAETEVANGVSEHVSLTETTNGIQSEAGGEAGEAVKAPLKKAPGARCEAPHTNGAPSAPHTPQDPLPVSDKLADLIPEVPDVPDMKTETLQETVTDVAVAN